MTIQFFFAAMSVLALSLPACAEDCQVLRAQDPSDTKLVAFHDVKQAGQYCLEGNGKAPRVNGLFGERDSPYRSMLEINAPHVVFDLRGFSLDVVPRGMQGVGSGDWRAPQQRGITVRNGAIHTRGGAAIDFGAPRNGSLPADFAAVYRRNREANPYVMSAAGQSAYKEFIEALPKQAAEYRETAHLIEKMKLVVDAGGAQACALCSTIRASGASNIVRNSTIEIDDGNAAIHLFGPNQLIENNIIVFKGRAALASAAAIKLHQGDGSIIRNNDIIVWSATGEAPQAAIALIDSQNVLVEGNRVYGIATLVRAWDERSSAIDSNNDFRWLLRWPWTGGEPGVH